MTVFAVGGVLLTVLQAFIMKGREERKMQIFFFFAIARVAKKLSVCKLMERE